MDTSSEVHEIESNSNWLSSEDEVVSDKEMIKIMDTISEVSETESNSNWFSSQEEVDSEKERKKLKFKYYSRRRRCLMLADQEKEAVCVISQHEGFCELLETANPHHEPPAEPNTLKVVSILKDAIPKYDDDAVNDSFLNEADAAVEKSNKNPTHTKGKVSLKSIRNWLRHKNANRENKGGSSCSNKNIRCGSDSSSPKINSSVNSIRDIKARSSPSAVAEHCQNRRHSNDDKRKLLSDSAAADHGKLGKIGRRLSSCVAATEDDASMLITF